MRKTHRWCIRVEPCASSSSSLCDRRGQNSAHSLTFQSRRFLLKCQCRINEWCYDRSNNVHSVHVVGGWTRWRQLEGPLASHKCQRSSVPPAKAGAGAPASGDNLEQTTLALVRLIHQIRVAVTSCTCACCVLIYSIVPSGFMGIAGLQANPPILLSLMVTNARLCVAYATWNDHVSQMFSSKSRVPHTNGTHCFEASSRRSLARTGCVHRSTLWSQTM